MIKMTMQDASFFRVESATTPTHITFMMTFIQPARTRATFVQKLHEHLLSFPVTSAPFNYRFVPSDSLAKLPVWEEVDDVDLEFHLRRESVVSPGGERELGELMSRLHAQPLDHAKPLWEMVLIEGLAKRRFVIYLKMHHAMADGLRLLKILQRSLTSSADEAVIPPWAVERNMEYTPPKTSATETWQKLTKLMKNQMAKGHQGEPIFPRGVKSLLNGKVSSTRRFTTQSVSLAQVKAVTKVSGATVNDVILAICSGALRRYFSEVDSIPDESLVAAIPVALPNYDGLEAGNALGGLTVSVATHIEDPRERLAAISKSTANSKAAVHNIPDSFNKGLNAVSMYFMGAKPPQNQSGEQRKVMNSFTVSNLPGPQQPLYFHGAQMESMYPASLLLPDQRLTIMLISYNGQINIGIVGCSDTLPHIQKIAEAMPDSLQELEQAFDL